MSHEDQSTPIERELTIVKKQQRYLLACCAILFCAIAVIAAVTFADFSTDREDGFIRTHGLVILDEEGDAKISLDARNGTPLITMKGPNGGINMISSKSGPRISFYDANQTERLSFLNPSTGPQILVRDQNGTNNLAMTETGIAIGSGGGNVRVSIGTVGPVVAHLHGKKRGGSPPAPGWSFILTIS